jgi:dienelactone hydrolase
LRDRLRLAWLAAICGPLIGSPSLSADELVQIVPHRATISFEPPGNSSPLFGYLARPEQPGRLPAVVVLHGCTGFAVHDVGAAAMLKTWGYVAVALDSLGAAVTCGQSMGVVAETSDAYAALRWLAAQDFVDADRVAVVGYSMGGSAVLNGVEQSPLASAPRHFRAAVAYYPDCNVSSGLMTVPVLILIGDRDDWASAAACRRLAAHESDIGINRVAGGVPVQLVVYPTATHAFDWRVGITTYLGHAIAFDAEAAGDAETRMRTFLSDVLR